MRALSCPEPGPFPRLLDLLRRPEPAAVDLTISGHPARILSYTAEQWARIPESVRPPGFAPLNGHHVGLVLL